MAVWDCLIGQNEFSLNDAFCQFNTIYDADLNDYTRTGVYYLGSNLTNAPSEWIKLIVLGANTNGITSSRDLIQIAVNVNVNPRYWIRARNGTTWYEWKSSVDFTHPVGTVIITSEVVNPGNTLGGTWELIDKEFTPGDLGDVMQMNSSNTSVSRAWCKRGGHSMSFNGTFTNSVEFNDTERNLGTLILENMGVTRLPDAFRFVGFSDGGNSEVFLLMENTGSLSSVDIGGNISSVASGKTWFWSLTCVWHNINYMLDSACNKFYWKRTA